MVDTKKGGIAMRSDTPAFSAALRRFQLRWRSGLIVSGILRAALWFGVVLLALGVFDFYSGFGDGVRRMIFAVLITISAAGVIGALWDALAFGRREAAREADRIVSPGRREMLSAVELGEGELSPHGSLSAWLRQQAVDHAGRSLKSVPPKRSLPVAKLRRAAWRFGTLAVVIGLLAAIWPQAVSVIGRRLLQPNADVPPYSRLQFSLSPQPAEVLYGDAILISAEITNDRIAAPVRCLTRDPATGRIDESSAYQENATRYSVKLEKMAAPVDVAFAVGRARSQWLPVAVRMQPKVQDVLVTVEPPAYSGLAAREFALGSQELAALPGSRITARLTSNRPLQGGTLRIAAFGSKAPEEEVPAEYEDTHRVRVAWTVRSAARLSVQVRDVAGTASAPVELEQKLLPDERPQAVMRQPAGDVLATPDSNLPLEATASDDFGLVRVSFVRQLHGYRERSLAQSVSRGQRQHEIHGNLNLAPFGLEPGQTIELTLEAGDTNPNLLGTGVSEPARIHIITREQYAEILRTQTTLEDFAGRYEALSNAMEEARKALDELERAAQSGDSEKAEQARREALAAHDRAAKVFGGIARDFPLFELDEALAKTTVDAMGKLFENAKELGELAGRSKEDIRDAVPGLKERLGATEKQMAKEMEKGKRAIAAAEVFEQTARLQQVIEDQRELVKDYNRTVEQIRRGEMDAGQALRDLARRQREIAQNLREMEKNMKSAIEKLPEDFANMREEGEEFLELFNDLKIPPTMDEGVRAAENSDSKTAGDRAAEALARLEALLRSKNGICQMCRGQGDGDSFSWPQDLAQTLKQLMDSLIPKPGNRRGDNPGSGAGGGPGFGGSSDSGFSMKGKMPRLPIYGPSRSKFARNAGPQVGSGQGRGTGQGRPEDGADVNDSKLTTKAKGDVAGEGLVLENVPETYREAVKRYFSTDEGPNKAPTRKPEKTQP
jgi:hypothetical protein